VDELCLKLDTVYFHEHFMFHIFSGYDIRLTENFCRHLHIMVPPVFLVCCLLVPTICSITPLFSVDDALLVRNICYKLMLEESIYDALL